MSPIAEKIQSLKDDFKRESKINDLKSYNLRAMFNIGSVANNKGPFEELYQDFDINFYFNELNISEDLLGKIKKIFREITKKYESEETAIEFVVKDRPWKMIPQKEQNIGLHGTLLNRLDFQRRVTNNYILALNMFQNVEVLEGDLGYPQREITLQQLISEIGGTGWLKESFYRVIPIIDLNNKSFYPVINDICYYHAMSTLLHFYYIFNKKTNTRRRCYEFFIKSKEAPERLKEKAEFIYSNKLTIFDEPESYRKMLNYSLDIINYIHSLFIKPSASHNNIFNKGQLVIDEDSKLISNILGKKINLYQRHYLLDDGDFDSLKLEASKVIAKIKNPKTEDYVDVIYNIILNDLNEANRVYFWNKNNLNRLFNKTDFILNDREITKNYFLNSWEKGLTTLIQWLNEIYINNEQIKLPQAQLAKVLLVISYKNYLKLQNDRIFSPKEIIKIMKRENINLDKIAQLPYKEQYFEYLRILQSLVKNLY